MTVLRPQTTSEGSLLLERPTVGIAGLHAAIAATLRWAAVGAFLLLAPALSAADQREEALAIIRAAETYIASFNQYEYYVTVNIDSAPPNPRFVGRMTMEGEVRRRGRETSVAYTLERIPPDFTSDNPDAHKIVDIYLEGMRIHSPQGLTIYTDTRTESNQEEKAPFYVESPFSSVDALFWSVGWEPRSGRLLDEFLREAERIGPPKAPASPFLYTVRREPGRITIAFDDATGSPLGRYEYRDGDPPLPTSMIAYAHKGQLSRKLSIKWEKQAGQMFPVRIEREHYGRFGKTLEDDITPKLEFVERIEADLAQLSLFEPIEPFYFTVEFARQFKSAARTPREELAGQLPPDYVLAAERSKEQGGHSARLSIPRPDSGKKGEELGSQSQILLLGMVSLLSFVLVLAFRRK